MRILKNFYFAANKIGVYEEAKELLGTMYVTVRVDSHSKPSPTINLSLKEFQQSISSEKKGKAI